jgi:hypothetical protein
MKKDEFKTLDKLYTIVVWTTRLSAVAGIISSIAQEDFIKIIIYLVGIGVTFSIPSKI